MRDGGWKGAGSQTGLYDHAGQGYHYL